MSNMTFTHFYCPHPNFTKHIQRAQLLNLQHRSYMLLTWSHLSLTSSICWTHSIRSTDMSGLNSVTERIASARAWNKESNQLFCRCHSLPRSSWKRKGEGKKITLEVQEAVLVVEGRHPMGVQGAAVKGQHPVGVQGAAKVSILWGFRGLQSVKGQHPVGVQGAAVSQRSAPCGGSGGCSQSKVSTLWGFRGLQSVKGQHPVGVQGAAVSQRSAPCGGSGGCSQSKVSTLWGFRGLQWMHYCYISSPWLAELVINMHHHHIYPHTHSIIVEVIISGGKHHLMLHTSLLDTILLCFVLHTYTHAIKTHLSPLCTANMSSKPTLLHFVLHIIYTHAIKTHPSPFCTAHIHTCHQNPSFSVLYCTHAIKTHPFPFYTAHTHTHTHTCHQNPSFSNVYCTHAIKTHPSPMCTAHMPSKPTLLQCVLNTCHQNPSFSILYCTHTHMPSKPILLQCVLHTHMPSKPILLQCVLHTHMPSKPTLLHFVLHTYTHAIKTHPSQFCTAYMPSKPILFHFILHTHTHAIKTHPSPMCTAHMPAKPTLLQCVLYTCQQNPPFSNVYWTHAIKTHPFPFCTAHTCHQNPSFSILYCTHTHMPSKSILLHFVLYTYHQNPPCLATIRFHPNHEGIALSIRWMTSHTSV